MKDYALNLLLGTAILSFIGFACYLYALGGAEIFFKFGKASACIYFTIWLWGPVAYYIGEGIRKKGNKDEM